MCSVNNMTWSRQSNQRAEAMPAYVPIPFSQENLSRRPQVQRSVHPSEGGWARHCEGPFGEEYSTPPPSSLKVDLRRKEHTIAPPWQESSVTPPWPPSVSSVAEDTLCSPCGLSPQMLQEVRQAKDGFVSQQAGTPMPTPLPSRGSFGHPFYCGAPCKYSGRKKACREGQQCVHCHLCQWTRKTSGLRGFEKCVVDYQQKLIMNKQWGLDDAVNANEDVADQGIDSDGPHDMHSTSTVDTSGSFEPLPDSERPPLKLASIVSRYSRPPSDEDEGDWYI